MHQLLAVTLALAVVQAGADPLVSRLAGRWSGTGTDRDE